MKSAFVAAACGAAFLLFAGGAQAHGGGRVGVWIGAPILVGPPLVYPYPYYYGPPVVREYNYPPPAYREPEPATPIEPPAPTWYYCRAARAYYPYVKTCPEGWQAVPAQPPGDPR